MGQNRGPYCGNTVFLEATGHDGSRRRTCAGPLGCGATDAPGDPEARKEAA